MHIRNEMYIEYQYNDDDDGIGDTFTTITLSIIESIFWYLVEITREKEGDWGRLREDHVLGCVRENFTKNENYGTWRYSWKKKTRKNTVFLEWKRNPFWLIHVIETMWCKFFGNLNLDIFSFHPARNVAMCHITFRCSNIDKIFGWVNVKCGISLEKNEWEWLHQKLIRIDVVFSIIQSGTWKTAPRFFFFIRSFVCSFFLSGHKLSHFTFIVFILFNITDLYELWIVMAFWSLWGDKTTKAMSHRIFSAMVFNTNKSSGYNHGHLY